MFLFTNESVQDSDGGGRRGLIKNDIFILGLGGLTRTATVSYYSSAGREPRRRHGLTLLLRRGPVALHLDDPHTHTHTPGIRRYMLRLFNDRTEKGFIF